MAYVGDQITLLRARAMTRLHWRRRRIPDAGRSLWVAIPDVLLDTDRLIIDNGEGCWTNDRFQVGTTRRG